MDSVKDQKWVCFRGYGCPAQIIFLSHLRYEVEEPYLCNPNFLSSHSTVDQRLYPPTTTVYTRIYIVSNSHFVERLDVFGACEIFVS
jgi:hypothetical protein